MVVLGFLFFLVIVGNALSATTKDPCTLIGGVCQDDKKLCAGGYLIGKCSGGGIHNQCCHKDLIPKLAKYPNYIIWTKADIKDPTDVYGVVEKFEGGARTTMYYAKPGDPTIGIGFSLNRKDGPEVFKKVLPGVDFQKVKEGKMSLAISQVRKLFEYDVSQIYSPRAKAIFGNDTYYNSLPANVKVALVNGVYRGDIGPKTKQLMKTKQWNKVVNEYLDNAEYKTAKADQLTGILTRMNWNAEQFDFMVLK